MDATAEAAMGSRKGLGEGEQIGTAFCWAHDMAIIGTIKLLRTYTSGMRADVPTKPVTATLVHQMAQQRCLCTEKGNLIGTQMRLKTIHRITPGPKRPRVLAHGGVDSSKGYECTVSGRNTEKCQER